MKLVDYILLVLIILLVVFCAKKGFAHTTGEGNCCGGKINEDRYIKSLKKNIVDTKVIKIEGMHCENCAIHIQNEINKIKDISAIVSLSKKEAIINSTDIIDEKRIILMIKKLGYDVKEV